MTATTTSPAEPAQRVRLSQERLRNLVLQIVAVAAVLGVIIWAGLNAAENLRRLNVASGFDFLGLTAGFDISVSLIPYDPHADTYGRAFFVGLFNTLFVSALGIVFATLWGFILGVARLSPNFLVSRVVGAYIELMRNTPLLLQIVFWYFAVLASLPDIRNSSVLFGSIFLNNRGLVFPNPVPEAGFTWTPVALAVGIVASIVIRIWAKRRQAATGQQFPIFWTALGLIVGLPALAIIVTGLPLHWEHPELQGLNFTGGVNILPEFMALVLALTIYTAAFIAEYVRGGILSVSKGQSEAALSLGLKQNVTMRLVIIPQAMRVILPPLTSEYLSLIKNSSLAVAIGYPDLVSVFASTTQNQTGQAIECLFITMMVYLTISIVVSVTMNWYNRRVSLVER